MDRRDLVRASTTCEDGGARERSVMMQAFVNRVRRELVRSNREYCVGNMQPVPSASLCMYTLEWKWTLQHDSSRCWLTMHVSNGKITKYTLEMADLKQVTFKRLRSLLLHAAEQLCPEEAVLLSSDSDVDSDVDGDGDGDSDMASSAHDEDDEEYLSWSIFESSTDWCSRFAMVVERNPAFTGHCMPAPTLFPCMDCYDEQTLRGEAHRKRIDRHNLEMGNCVLHMTRNGKPVLTLKRIVKNAVVMLGLFAATNIEVGSIVALYLGTVVEKGKPQDPSASNNRLDQHYIIRHRHTFCSGHVQEDEIIPKGEPVAASKHDAFHLAHFINSCDAAVAVHGERSNCILRAEGGQVEITARVRAGEELLCTYGDDYWNNVQDTDEDEMDDGDSDYEDDE